MRNRLLPLALLMLSCNDEPVVNTAGGTGAEGAHPATYVKVNYEVRKNLVGKKIIEGNVLNTGRFQTYISASQSIDMDRSRQEGDHGIHCAGKAATRADGIPSGTSLREILSISRCA